MLENLYVQLTGSWLGLIKLLMEVNYACTGSSGPKIADRTGVNYGLGALQALQQLSLQEAVKRADSFDQ